MTKTLKATYVVYGAGDKGTAELRDLFFQKRIPIEFADTRDRNDMGDLDNVVTLQLARLNSVPQTFFRDADGTVRYIGDFEQTVAHLKTTFSFGTDAPPEPVAA